ncbi:MAG: insulinase family protein [Chloroflexi bacterium]|nr:insulinase family protein [Chloroflexota bacterium]
MRPLPPLDYHLSVLDNGLKVVTYAMPHSLSVSSTLTFRVGSRHETHEVAGISHFVEHMLFKGTSRRPTPRDIAVAIEGVGGVLNAGTDKEMTSYWVKVPFEQFAMSLDLLADVVRNPLLLKEEVKKERRVIAEELSMIEDTPQELVNGLLDELIWPDHPLGWEIAGTLETVKRMKRSSLRAYFERYYRPNRAVLSIVGCIDHGHALEEATKLFADWRPAEPPDGPAPVPQRSSKRSGYREKDIEQVHLCLGLGGLPRRHPSRRVLDLYSLVLGGSMASRLFLEIRERLSLAYDIQTFVDYFTDCGVAVIAVATKPEKVEECFEAIRREMVLLMKEPVPIDELQRAQLFLKGRTVLGMEDTMGLSQWLGGQLLMDGRILDLEVLLREIDAVTQEDVLRIAGQVSDPELLRLAGVGPAEGFSAFERLTA